MVDDSETVYDRIAKLEDEVAALRSEIDFLKRALRNEIARHEVKMAKKGYRSIFAYRLEFSLTLLINSRMKSASSASGSSSRYLFSKGKALS